MHELIPPNHAARLLEPRNRQPLDPALLTMP